MATYKYRSNFYTDLSGTYRSGWIKYNITPDGADDEHMEDAPYIGLGTKVTITGQISAPCNVKTIGAVLLDGNVSPYDDYRMVTYVNKSVATGSTATFSMTWTIDQAFLDDMLNDDWDPTLQFIIGTKTLSARMTRARLRTLWSDGIANFDVEEGETTSLACCYRIYKYVGRPSNGSSSCEDMAPVSALTVFGYFAANHSVPRINVGWVIDNHHPDMTNTVALTVSGVMTGTYEVSAGGGVNQASFDLPTPTANGWLHWTVTITQMDGKQLSISAAKLVIAYAKPYITSCAFERYQEVQTDTGFEHEASPSGEYIWLNLDANIAAVDSRNAWTATLTAWRKERPEIAPTAGSAVYENTTGERRTVSTWALAGSDGQHIQLARDEDNLSDEMVLSAAFDWCLRLTLTDALGNSVTLLVDDDIRKDSAILDVGPYGVSVGARSTALAADPQFECSYPATFYGNVAVPANGLLKVVPLSVLASTSIAAGGYKYDTFTIAQSAIGEGWTPVGVVGHVINNRYISVYNLQVRTDNPMQLTYGLYNGSSAARATTLSVNVLCVRTGL